MTKKKKKPIVVDRKIEKLIEIYKEADKKMYVFKKQIKSI